MLLQRMSHIFPFVDLVLFKRKQEVLLCLTHGNQHCSAQSAFILIKVCTASRASLALCLFSPATR